MKQFIVMTAVLPLLLVFFLQFANDQRNDVRMGIVNDIVYAAKEEARQEGAFSKELQAKMRTRIAESLDISPDRVHITATETPRYRITDTQGLTEAQLERGMLSYRVEVPVGSVMAGRSLFGLRDADNTCWCIVEGTAPSERLRQ